MRFVFVGSPLNYFLGMPFGELVTVMSQLSDVGGVGYPGLLSLSHMALERLMQARQLFWGLTYAICAGFEVLFFNFFRYALLAFRSHCLVGSNRVIMSCGLFKARYKLCTKRERTVCAPRICIGSIAKHVAATDGSALKATHERIPVLSAGFVGNLQWFLRVCKSCVTHEGRVVSWVASLVLLFWFYAVLPGFPARPEQIQFATRMITVVPGVDPQACLAQGLLHLYVVLFWSSASLSHGIVCGGTFCELCVKKVCLLVQTVPRLHSVSILGCQLIFKWMSEVLPGSLECLESGYIIYLSLVSAFISVLGF